MAGLARSLSLDLAGPSEGASGGGLTEPALSDNDPIKLNVGGTVFTTTLKVLRKEPDSIFPAMFSGPHYLLPRSPCSYTDHNAQVVSAPRRMQRMARMRFRATRLTSRYLHGTL